MQTQLMIALVARGECEFVVPSESVDQVWHCWLETADYETFCRANGAAVTHHRHPRWHAPHDLDRAYAGTRALLERNPAFDHTFWDEQRADCWSNRVPPQRPTAPHSR